MHPILLARSALAATCPAGDADLDGVCDDVDDCPSVYDPGQGAPFEDPAFVSLTVGTLFAVDTRVAVADLDGDGLDDVLVAGLLEVEWFAGTGGGFAPDATVTGALSVVSLEGADLDGDGDADVLAGSTESGYGTWWVENLGGGAFGPRQVLQADARGPASAGDLDGDGDLDVVYSSDAYLAWRENLGGGTFTGPRRDVAAWVADASPEVPGVDTVDLDGDGDVDIVAGSPYPAWYDNQGGGNLFQRFLGGDVPSAWTATDLDADGDADLLAVFDRAATSAPVVAYRNLGGTNVGTPEEVVAVDVVLASAIATDVDGDGLPDLVAAGSVGADPGLWLARNLGGLLFDVPLRLDPADGLASVAAVDGDQDGSPDLVVGRRTDQPPYPPVGDVRWYRNALPLPPDLDADGLCDPDDPCLDPPVDADGDGVCEQSGDGAALDCDDADPDRFPGATEVCDGIDNRCAGAVPPDETDGDGDGSRVCDLDCDDADPVRFPGATETCNGLDDDCNGLVDPGCPAPETEPEPVPPTPDEKDGGCGCEGGGGGGGVLWGATIGVALLIRRRRAGRGVAFTSGEPSR